MNCKYDMPWIGKCNKDSGDAEYCEEHSKETCRCGQQATHGCSATCGLVCGVPVCSDCGGMCKTHR